MRRTPGRASWAACASACADWPMAADATFTDALWRSIEGIYADILAHPFLAGLSSGQLAKEKFQYYVVQDSLYLKDFSRCLAIVQQGARDTDRRDVPGALAHGVGGRAGAA